MKLLRQRTPNNNQQFPYREPDNYDYCKRPINIFRESSNLPRIKKIVFRTPNIYRSFINSSAPFNYYRNPSDKNSYFICYNGGPKKNVRVSRNLKNLNRGSVYENNRRQYGSYSQNSIPRLNRSLNQYENDRYNNLNFQNNQYNRENNNYFNRTGFQYNRHISPAPNRNNFNGYITDKPFMNKNEKINYSCDKNEFNKNSRYDNNEIDNNDEKNKIDSNKFTSSSSNFYSIFDKSFHKTQIFNRCKPFLVDQFQEFPD